MRCLLLRVEIEKFPLLARIAPVFVLLSNFGQTLKHRSPMLDTFCHLLAKNRDHRGTHSPSEREPSSNGIRISAHTANISVSTPRSYLSHVSPHLLAYIIR